MSKKDNIEFRPNKHTNLKNTKKAFNEDKLFEILDQLDSSDPFLLILEHVQDPHNLGACLRSASGAGVDAVIIPKDHSVGLTDTVRTISCGGADDVPLIEVTNIARFLRELKKRNIWLVGTSDQKEKSLYEIDLKGPLAILLGSEEKGLRRLTMDECDFLVSLPMSGTVESLNVSVATGICLYEAVRQRSQKS